MLERPLIYLIPASAAALYCAVCLNIVPNLYLSLLLFSLFLICAGALAEHKRLFALLCMLAAASLSFAGFSLFHAIVVEPVRELAGRHAEITATVLQDAAVYDDSQRVELSVDDNDVLPGSFRMLCYFPVTKEPLHAGDRIKANVGFYLPTAAEGFDRAAYQASNGCYVAASYTENESGQPISFTVIESNGNKLRWLPQRIARFCSQSVSEALPAREAGLLNGLLIGDTGLLPEDDTLAFRISGLSHMVAVSGMHIAFLVAFCYMLLGRRIGTWVSIPLILLFVPIAGATPSVIRAAVMYLIAAGAFITRREASSLNSLFAALGLLLLVNPYAIASLSLQLSFAATLGLILFSGRMQGRLIKPFSNLPKPAKKLVSAVAGALSCTVCATIFTAPILLSSFGYVSILSLVSNLLVVGVTAVCFIGGFLLCVSAVILPAAVPMIARMLQPLLDYILWVANMVADIPLGLVSWGDSFGLAALALAAVAMLLWLTAGKLVKWKAVLPCICVLVIVLSGAGAYFHEQQYTVTYLPCGSGQAIIVSDADNMTLIDCAGDGGYRDAAALVREWMRWNNHSRIDVLILTAVDRGHARDLPALLEQTEVGQILIPAGCKEIKTNRELMELVRSVNAQEIPEKQVVYTGTVPVMIFPITDGKLGVQISDEILVLHSPTQKQLAAYLEENDAPSAPEVVLSERNLEDQALLAQALDAMNAERILLQARSRDIITEYNGLPVESPYLTGEIVRRFTKE